MDLTNCLEFIKNNYSMLSKIDDIYFYTLVLAEDHRNRNHLGVDPIAVIRCIYVKVFKQKRQGGSTIEQQFVRTLTNHREKTINRKIREQVISILLFLNVKDKKTIGKAYLYCAYYGYNQEGFFNLSEKEIIEPEEIIARLKYPTGKNEPPSKNKLVQMRKNHIKKLKNRTSNYI
ncbi:hypothetical protein ETAR_14830 [Edwardsiella tarda]